MAVRTIPHSVEKVGGPPPELPALDVALAALRRRYPEAIFRRYLGFVPEVAEDAYIAPGAVLIGRVRVGAQASVWPGCVLRADIAEIVLGARSNLQDGVVVHLGDEDPTVLGEDVVVGHRAVLHGCTVEDACLVGIQATLLDGCRIGQGSVVGAGALVPAGRVVPARSLVLGMPAQVVKTLDPAAEDFHRALAGKYTRLAHNHRWG